jgi:hypothetical protein
VALCSEAIVIPLPDHRPCMKGVHPSLQMPTDEAAYDIAVVAAAHARERAGGPLRVADGEFIASRQGAVLDQQTADVVEPHTPPPGQFVTI